MRVFPDFLHLSKTAENNFDETSSRILCFGSVSSQALFSKGCDEMREMSMDEQKRLLVDAFVNLPPIIRHELLEIIEAHESGNVIRLKTQVENK